MQFMKQLTANFGRTAKCNQRLRKAERKEAVLKQELIIALPESFVDYEPDKLLKLFTEHFKQNMMWSVSLLTP